LSPSVDTPVGFRFGSEVSMNRSRIDYDYPTGFKCNKTGHYSNVLGPDVDWINQVDTGEDVPGHEHRFSNTASDEPPEPSQF
jgi:hypothetical protein